MVKDVLDEERLAKIRRGCEIAIRELVGRDPERSGNRGSHRYSFQDNGQSPPVGAIQVIPPAAPSSLTRKFSPPKRRKSAERGVELLAKDQLG